jgi:hypothetical protein
MKHLGKLKRTAIAVALMILCFSILCITARSAPINGSWSDRVEIESKVWSQTRTFRGGERAAVLAIGDHEEHGAKLQVAVFDAKGALIAADKGEGELASDYVGLVWYPPRDGDYRIEVSHSGAAANRIYIAIK